MPAPIAIRLAIRQWAARPLRPILCSLAIAAAVALIICVGVAMDSLRYTLSAGIGRALGVAEVHVRPLVGETDDRIPKAMLDRIRGMPEVDIAGGRLHAMAVLVKGADHRVFNVLGIDPLMDERLRPQTYKLGRPLSAVTGDSEMVVDAIVAEVLKLEIGEKIDYTQNESHHILTLVGIIQKPTIELLAKPTLYVTLPSLTKDLGIAPAYNVLDIKLKDSTGIDDFDAYAVKLNKTLGPAVEVTPGTSSKAKLSELTRTLRLMLLILSTMAAFCAALIIGTTLSVGVQERIRQFGQLRCIGASRGQLALFLLGDAAVMLVIGQILGALLGWGLSATLVASFPNFFMAYQVTFTTVAIAFFCGTAATLVGAMIPVWQVSRVSPMAAVTSVANAPRKSRVWLAAGVGVLCLAVQASLWMFLPTRDARFYSYVGAGIPLIFIGWCLLAPALLMACERFGANVLGLLFGLRPALLRQAWSRTPWRAGAMIAALMVGVTLFVTIRARGQSLMASWTTPARIPDLIVKSTITGLNDKRIEYLHRQYPELGDVTLLEYFGVHMTDKIFQLGAMFGEGETTFIAVDPQPFARMIELEYIQGEPETALKQLAEGRHVFVSKEFHNVRKLGVGDKLSLRGSDGKVVEFTIAAVVTSTGIELVKNYFDLRASFSERSVSSVLGTLSDAKKYFHLSEPTLMLADLKPGTLVSSKDMSDLVLKMNTESGFNTISSRELKTTLTALLQRLMNGLSVIGLGALCVASLGVANMVIASVHARRFEFGVLRAIGAGRGQLVRLVLAEAALIGVVAGILGAAAGLHYAFMATCIDFLIIGFPTSFLALQPGDAFLSAIWLILIAIGLTSLLAWLASLAPAIRGAFSAQRTLLASGRT